MADSKTIEDGGPLPHIQTNSDPDTGNCWSTCIASLLRMPAASVPNFCGDPPRNRYWAKETQDWLAQFGMGIVTVASQNENGAFFVMPAGECILTGKSPRGEHLHSIVGRVSCPDGINNEFAYLHDPSPHGGFIDGLPKEISFLVPLRADAMLRARKGEAK